MLSSYRPYRATDRATDRHGLAYNKPAVLSIAGYTRALGDRGGAINRSCEGFGGCRRDIAKQGAWARGHRSSPSRAGDKEEDGTKGSKSPGFSFVQLCPCVAAILLLEAIIPKMLLIFGR